MLILVLERGTEQKVHVLKQYMPGRGWPTVCGYTWAYVKDYPGVVAQERALFEARDRACQRCVAKLPAVGALGFLAPVE